MDQFTEERLQQISRQGYHLDFGAIFNMGFTIWKRVTIPILGATLLMAIPAAAIYFLSMPWVYGMDIMELAELRRNSPNEYIYIINSTEVRLKLLSIISIVGVLLGPLQAGFYRMCYEADYIGYSDLSSAFVYYKFKYWSRILVVNFSVFVLTTLPAFLLGFLGPIVPILNIPYILTLHIFTLLAVPLIIFGDATPLQAIKYAFRLGAKGFFPLVGFSIIAFLLAFLGALACCIGIFFSISYVYVIYYLAYRQAIGFEENSEDEISPTIEAF